MIIIDDQEDSVTLFRRLLRKCDSLQIDHSYDGYEGFKMLENNKYDIAVIDLALPRVNGYELIEFIRNQKMDTLVVVCSAFTEVSNRFVRNIDAYIPKPINIMSFKTTLDKLCSMCQTRKLVEYQEEKVEV